MSSEDPARLIAERVAQRLSSGAPADRSEPKPGNGAEAANEGRRARVINFISATPPAPTRSSIGSQTAIVASQTKSAPPSAQSPWLAPFARGDQNQALHPSEERFGVEEAAVSELVEFFENEKLCTIDPSGKPCDHCAMCSSRGF